MSQIFNRTYRLVFGLAGQPGAQITGLRVAFKVEKHDGASANTATIKVWNLSKTTRELAQQSNAIVQLFAGYGDNAPLIFLGAITRVTEEDDGVNSVTTIHSGKATTGAAPLSTTINGQAFARDVLGKAIEPLQAIGVDVTAVPNKPIAAPRGITLSGEPGAVLNKLTRANNLDWWIEDGVVTVAPRGFATQDTAFVISPQSGLEGSPRPIKPSKDVGGSRLSVELTARLNAEFRVRRILQVANTRELAGWYLIRRILHEGDTWATGSKSWSSTVEATPIQARTN